MSALPWIKVWTRVTGHPKVARLERVLGVPDALGIVIRLWAWTADYHPDGQFPEGDALEAARAAQGPAAPGEQPERILAALAEVGLVDRVPGAFRVHDWSDMQTRHLEAEERRRAGSRARQARWRARTALPEKNEGQSEIGTPPSECGSNGKLTRYVTRDVTSTVTLGKRDSRRYVTQENRGEEKLRNSACDRSRSAIGRTDGKKTKSEVGVKSAATGQGADLDATRRYPLTASVLDALRARGFVLEWPRSVSATDRLERAIAEVTAPVAIDRCWAVIETDRASRVAPKEFAGWYVDTIRGEGVRRRPRSGYADRWQDRLTQSERSAARTELAAIHPDLAEAPLGCEGDPARHPVDAIKAFNARWRAKVEGRS